MANFSKISLISWVFGILLTLPLLASAQTTNETDIVQSPMMNRLQTVGNSSGFQIDQTKASVPIIAGTIVRTLLGLLGVIFIVLIIIAGFKWMTAGGNEEEIKKATGTMKNAIIGLVIALSAWSIWTFVLEKIIIG